MTTTQANRPTFAGDSIFDWLESQNSTNPSPAADGLKALADVLRNNPETPIPSLVPLLPGLLSLRGKPYQLDKHFPMEPLFATSRPWRTLYRCGRQTSKSTSLAAQGLITAASVPYLQVLYVLPLYEMTRRFSSNYVRSFVEESPIKKLMMDSSCENSVLQKTMTNKARLFFSYACLNADRIRGLSIDMLMLDEIQDLDFDHIPIIRETMSASAWGFEQYSGTPKTFDNTIEVLWQDSSQAEWVIHCQACNHYNISSTDFDAMKMMGPVSNIAKHGTALICAACGRPIDAAAGCWVHRIPERSVTFAGYHAPQIIFPMHYADEKKWATLLNKRDRTVPAVFLNECMGESCDVGAKLVTLSDLRAASLLHKAEWHVAIRIKFAQNYIFRALGIDWGGRGKDETSFTTLTIIGVTPDGRYHTIWAERLHSTTSDVEEIKRIIEVFNTFSCHFLAHDYGGSGSVHETLLIQSGFPLERIMPISYTHMVSKQIIVFNQPPDGSTRHFYSVDKTRSLLLMCTLVKTLHLLLPEFESSKDITEDLLHLVKEKTETRRAGDILLIRRQPGQSDDFAHSTNFALCCCYHYLQRFPDLANTMDITMTAEQLNIAEPPDSEVTFDL